MYKLKRIVFCILLLALIIKTNECYGMETNENKREGKTVMEKIKTLPYSKIFICGNKLFFSLAHSIINNFYELEKLEMNKVYSLKKYLCWGYRLQPTSLAPFSFLDFNVNILGGIIDTAIFLYLYRSSGIKTTSKIFYSITSFLNINLNIRIKSDFYIAINILGLMRAIFMHFLIKKSNKNENDNNLDNNLSNNNNPVDNNENNILNNYKESNINEYNNNLDVKKENDILNNIERKKIIPEKSIVGNANPKNKTDENKNHNNINPDFNNKNFNQENNNEDEWEKIKKENGISEEQDKRIQEMYDDLEESYRVSGFRREEEIKKIIFDKNFDKDKILEDIMTAQ